MNTRFPLTILFRALMVAIICMGWSMIALADTLTVSNGAPTLTISTFGYPNTATYGQTITTVAGTTQLNSFSFYINPSGGPITYRAYVMAWDGTKATGPVLFESGNQVASAAGLNSYTYNTGGLNLVAASQYVLFVSVSSNYVAGNGYGVMGARGDFSYSGGQFVYMNNGGNFGLLTTNGWSGFSDPYDLAFTAEFSGPDGQTPEPASLLLLGTGCAGLLAQVRRRMRLKK